MEISIATRKSILAQVQADIVGKMLENKFNITYKKYLVVTEGDKRLDTSLSKIGGKGLFTKEVELALLNKEADIAVHSMKDVPYDILEDFEIISILKREDKRDVFVSNTNEDFTHLKKNAKIGTSSVRRSALLKQIRPDLKIVPIRGNVQTRLQKMKENNLDGIVLAAAGLKRLNMENIITEYFDPEIFLPAVGQGALGVECLKSNLNKDMYKKLDHFDTRIEMNAERSFMKELKGDCHSLIGIYSKIEGNLLYLIGTFMINGTIVKKDITGNKENCISLGKMLAHKIIKGV